MSPGLAEVPPGGDVEYQVTVALLPADAAELAFRTLQTYGDGHVDRWSSSRSPVWTRRRRHRC